MLIEEAFNRSIAYYDDWMKRALPNYTDIFRTALELIPFAADEAMDVLDLGAGTGLFSQHVFDKFPNSRFVLYDLAEKMLGVAQERFAGHLNQFRYVVGDYRKIEGTQEYDLVISSLSIHHLEHEDKRALFHRIFQLLKKDGIFINVDQIHGETPYLRDLYWNHWLEQIRESGASEERIQESIDAEFGQVDEDDA